MQKKRPLGVTDFKELIEGNYYYVDKSLFIKEVHESPLAIMLTRPSKFGKSLNLSMLRYFFEMGDHAHLFKDLAIWEHEEYRKLQGTYPVIHLSFKELTQDTFPAMLTKFGEIMAAEFKRHKEVLSSPNISDYYKKDFEEVLNQTASEVDLEHSIDRLLNMIDKHHNKNALVFIDDYDVPLQTGDRYGFYDQIFCFIMALLVSSFKDQPHLSKGIISGQLPIIMADTFSGLNNIVVENITDEGYSASFGFTTDEVNQLLSYYNIKPSSDIAQWYDGYLSGNIKNLYNPFSILKCLQNNGVCKQYWSPSYHNDLLDKLLSNAYSFTIEELASLIEGNTLETTIEEQLIYKETDFRIWSVLVFLGYLTYSHKTLDKGKELCRLVVPNHEIKLLLQQALSAHQETSQEQVAATI